MTLNRAKLRSAPAQLLIMAGVFLAAILLALVAVWLRPGLFDLTIGESRPSVPDSLRTRAHDLATGRAAGEPLSGEDINHLYTLLIDEPDVDPDGNLATHLLSLQGEVILNRVRQTLVVGNLSQRIHATRILARAPADTLRPQVVELCRYALQRGQRRGESQLIEAAQGVLWQLGEESPPSGIPQVPD